MRRLRPIPRSNAASTPPRNPAPSLETIVADCIEGIAKEGDRAVDRCCAAHPDLASEIRAQIDVLSRLGLLSDGPDAAWPERLGDFRLERLLGGGGMGLVYLATQESLGRSVALKLIRPEAIFFAGSRERFRREVNLAARLRHEAIVPVFAVGGEHGVPYYAMELVVGASLGAIVSALEADGRPAAAFRGVDARRAIDETAARQLGPERFDTLRQKAAPTSNGDAFHDGWADVVLSVVLDAALALDHAHGQGILHRDVKPSNIMVDRTGRARLVDFGLARSSEMSSLTATGATVGSVPYLAPEQLRGEPIDVRADVYALGVTLYEALTLRSPFRSDSDEATRRRIARGRPTPIQAINPAVSWDLATVCETAMDIDPDRRYPTAAAFARDLANARDGRPIEARRAGTLLRARRFVGRHPTLSVAVLLVSLLAIGLPSALLAKEHQARLRILAEKRETESERTKAEANERTVRHALEYLVQLFSAAGPDHAAKGAITARSLLDAGIARIADLPEDPATDAELSVALARASLALGEETKATMLCARALDRLARLETPSAPLAVRAHHVMARLEFVRGDIDAAERQLDAAIAHVDRVRRSDTRFKLLADLRLTRADVAGERGAHDAMRAEAIAVRRALEAEGMASSHLHAIATLKLAEADHAADRHRAVLETTAALLEREGATPRLRSDALAEVHALRAAALARTKNFRDAITHCERSVDLMGRSGYRNPIRTGYCLMNLGALLAQLVVTRVPKHYAERANEVLLQAERKIRGAPGNRYDGFLRTCATLRGQMLVSLGRFDEAEPLLRSVAARLRHPRKLSDVLALAAWAHVQARRGAYPIAIGLMERAVNELEDRHGWSANVHDGLVAIGDWCRKSQRRTEAMGYYERALTTWSENVPNGHIARARLAAKIAQTAQTVRAHERAERWWKCALAIDHAHHATSPLTGAHECHYGRWLMMQGRLEEARTRLEAGWRRIKPMARINPRAVRLALRNLVACYDRLGRPDVSARYLTALEAANHRRTTTRMPRN